MIALAILGPVILAVIVAVALVAGKPRQALDHEARSCPAIQWGAAVTSA